jgi:hypothetical protein
MFDSDYYNKLKLDLQLSYQYFNNLRADSSEKEFKFAIKGINTALDAISVFTYKAKEDEK